MTAYEQIEALVYAYGSERYRQCVAEQTKDHRVIDRVDGNAEQAYNALLAAVKALAEDVERYAWLRDTPYIGIMRNNSDRRYSGWSVKALHDWHDGETLDEAIDAARQSTTSAGEKP